MYRAVGGTDRAVGDDGVVVSEVAVFEAGAVVNLFCRGGEMGLQSGAAHDLRDKAPVGAGHVVASERKVGAGVDRGALANGLVQDEIDGGGVVAKPTVFVVAFGIFAAVDGAVVLKEAGETRAVVVDEFVAGGEIGVEEGHKPDVGIQIGRAHV